jgi:hypothetical protein
MSYEGSDTLKRVLLQAWEAPNKLKSHILKPAYKFSIQTKATRRNETKHRRVDSRIGKALGVVEMYSCSPVVRNYLTSFSIPLSLASTRVTNQTKRF